MELYEIIKKEKLHTLSYNPLIYDCTVTVVTATIDKNIANQMLEIYQANCGNNESYEIRILSKEN